MDPLKICFVSSEIVPFAKTGGLADVSGALGKYLSHSGADVRLFMPHYNTIDAKDQSVYVVDFLQNIPIEFGGFTLYFTALTTKLPQSNADVYFIHCEGLYNRGQLYTNDGDEYLRFALLSHAAIICCQRMGWGPDIFHCNDWQSALIPLLLKTHYEWDQLFAHSKTALTVHNIGYQGIFGKDVVEKLRLSQYKHLLPSEDLQSGIINYMKIGLLYCDKITTVSETYAKEIQSAEFGAGMEGLLQHRSHALVGIVNGVDYEEWSPESDTFIPFSYSADDLSGKTENKKYLLEKMGLSYNPDVPVYGIVSRLTGQKGFELLYETLYDFLTYYDVRFIVLGSGEQKYTDFFYSVQQRFPGKFCFYNGFNVELSHLIEAGSDVFVMPSQYEPCGLNQIYSLKYGTVPIVRKTGGLADTVQFYHWESQSGTGFVFEEFSGQGLRWAMEHAYKTFQHKEAWEKLMRNGMAQDFSWERQVEKYLALYRSMLG